MRPINADKPMDKNEVLRRITARCIVMAEAAFQKPSKVIKRRKISLERKKTLLKFDVISSI